MIVGCPTWNTGADEMRSGTTWDHYLETIKGYDDNFCDGIEELHDTFAAAGAKMVGYVDSDGYDFSESKSVRNGKFLGLPCDQDNEGDQSEARIASWVEQLKAEGMPF